jgi:CubicO group peptidase (beta-lactamase class C family)
MSFETFLQEKIFEPLSMVDTHFHVPPDKVNRFASQYQHNFKDNSFHLFTGSPHIPLQDFTIPTNAPSGGGGLLSTTEDYFKFAHMLLNKGELDGTRLLGRKTLEHMTINHLKPEHMPFGIGLNQASGMGFGLGFSMVIDLARAGVMNSIGNYGWNGAAATNFWVDPQEEIVGIIMTQLMDNMLPFRDELRVMTYQALID